MGLTLERGLQGPEFPSNVSIFAQRFGALQGIWLTLLLGNRQLVWDTCTPKVLFAERAWAEGPKEDGSSP
jgi:hypothetical protein